MVSKILSTIKKYWGWVIFFAILISIGYLLIQNKVLKNRLDGLRKFNLEQNQKVVYDSIPAMLDEKEPNQLCNIGGALWVD